MFENSVINSEKETQRMAQRQHPWALAVIECIKQNLKEY
jgi:hypothetical protein